MHDLQNHLNMDEPCFTDPDPDKWVGSWTESTSAQVAAELCAGCPVLEICREYAIVNDEKYFIWGGLTPQQRREERIARRRRTKKITTGLAQDSDRSDEAT